MKKETEANLLDNKSSSNNQISDIARIDAKNLNDSEVSLQAVNKINYALFDIIHNMKRQEFSDNQEIIKSRAFSRVFQSGNQMLSNHQKLLEVNQELTKQIESIEAKNKESIAGLEHIHKQKHDEFVAQLGNLETQLKMTQIEKENLQIEINNLQASDRSILEQTIKDTTGQLEVLEVQNKKLKDDVSRAFKEKTSLSDKLMALRLELDSSLDTLRSLKSDPNSKVPGLDDMIESQSKQIKDQTDECTSLKDQLNQAYSELESIYEANQDLENKNKLLSTQLIESNKLSNKIIEESFKKSRVNENCKKQVFDIENELKAKEKVVSELKQKQKILEEKLYNEQQSNLTLVKRDDILNGIIKSHEKEIQELKKAQSEMKLQIDESDIIISKVQTELQEKMVRMTVNYIKTGKISDPKFTSVADVDITELELQKYKQMVKCPTCQQERDRNTRLPCSHTFCDI